MSALDIACVLLTWIKELLINHDTNGLRPKGHASMTALPNAITAMRRLHACGIKIAAGEFGKWRKA
jgi:hypothetical protein